MYVICLNVEPNDDELSAWCKLHGSEFAGKLIPYGARVNYKPPKTREAGQLHKFGPDSIPGVFAGYHIGPGPSHLGQDNHKVMASE